MYHLLSTINSVNWIVNFVDALNLSSLILFILWICSLVSDNITHVGMHDNGKARHISHIMLD